MGYYFCPQMDHYPVDKCQCAFVCFLPLSWRLGVYLVTAKRGRPPSHSFIHSLLFFSLSPQSSLPLSCISIKRGTRPICIDCSPHTDLYTLMRCFDDPARATNQWANCSTYSFIHSLTRSFYRFLSPELEAESLNRPRKNN